MRLVYLAFPNHHTLCDKLSWSLAALVKSEPKQLQDIVRSPAILEFVGIDHEAYKEKELEAALIKNMRMSLMELGRGFALDAEQRFTSAGVEMARQYLAAVKESNDVENVTLNGQPFTRAAKMSHHW